LNNIIETGVSVTQLTKQLLNQARLLLIEKVGSSSQETEVTSIMKIINSLVLNQNKELAMHLPILQLEMAILQLTDPIINKSNSNITNYEEEEEEETITTNVKEDKKSVMTITDSLTLDLINKTENWKLFVKKVWEINPQVGVIISQSKPIKTEKECLYLNVPYTFHKNSLESTKSKAVLSKA